MDPDAAQTRLIAVIEGLFRRRQAPVLMILEDLHWAGSESLRLVSRIARMVSELPLFMVGTYRDDERSDLPVELPGMSVLKLRRLTGAGIAALALSMLGERGRHPEVVERLRRETEGNRSSWSRWCARSPRRPGRSAGSASTACQDPAHRRHAPHRAQAPRARPAARAPAARGRGRDRAPDRARAARAHRSRDRPRRLDHHLRQRRGARPARGGFRFAHDKLREGLLSDLSPEARRDLHRQVAEAIEAEHPGAPERTAALAHHWGEAGVPEKEAHHSALAGEQALQSSAYQEAVTFLERAITLVSAGSEAAAPQRGGAIGRALAALGPILPLRREPSRTGAIASGSGTGRAASRRRTAASETTPKRSAAAAGRSTTWGGRCPRATPRSPPGSPCRWRSAACSRCGPRASWSRRTTPARCCSRRRASTPG